MQKKGSTELCEIDFRKIMEFLADYLKMIKLYEKIFCDSGDSGTVFSPYSSKYPT